jgi:tocopherol O-methyltransferase
MSKQLDNVLAYYKSTNFDYEHYWSGKKALALHFGYYDTPQTQHEQSLHNMNQKLAELAYVTRRSKVLDAGCGYGGSALWLAENIGCKVTGVTVVPYQVQKAQKAAAGSPAAKQLTFIEGDYAHTDLPDDSFDVVWGLESIVHCDDKAGLIKEAYRLLKPGGRLIISEYLLRDNPPLSKSEHDRMQPWLDGWMMPDLLTPSHYKKLYKAAGFAKTAVHDLSENVEPSLKKCQRNAGMALPFVGVLKKLHLIDTIRRDYTIANYQLYDTFQDGLWSYQVVVGSKS